MSAPRCSLSLRTDEGRAWPLLQGFTPTFDTGFRSKVTGLRAARRDPHEHIRSSCAPLDHLWAEACGLCAGQYVSEVRQGGGGPFFVFRSRGTEGCQPQRAPSACRPLARFRGEADISRLASQLDRSKMTLAV
jgi:hypothetical protein